MNSLWLFYFALVFFNAVYFSSACIGCVLLDQYSFDKIVPRFEAVLVKFDVPYPYTDKHDIFLKLASEVAHNKNFILANVGINRYGENDKTGFSKKYGIKSKDDLPTIRLFVQGEDEPFAFEKNNVWTDENLKKFVRDYTNIYLELPGCLETFDKLAIKFSSSSNKEKVLEETEKAAKKITSEREQKIADTYIKYMRKAIESASFITQESSRLENILKDGKINEKKKENLSRSANILKSFVMKPDKSEL